jgi:hypothetical protein
MPVQRYYQELNQKLNSKFNTMSNNNKGYNISLQATSKMGGALITTAKGNRALLLQVDGSTVVEKDGQAYVNLTAWISDTADQYGNHVGIQARISKAEKEAGGKAPYVGNGKQFYPQVEQASAPVAQAPSIPTPEEDLPF